MYAYDEMGNILNRYAYAYTTGTLGSSTNTKSWYYGTSSTFGKICYGIDGQDDLWIDSFGNPYYNNETCEYFTWQGRELTYYDNSMDQYYYYTYNSDGIRTGKRMEEYAETKETVTYYLDGTQIIREIRDHVDDGTKDIFYYYDENGAPVGMSYGGPTYTYYKNIFGDILGIFDESGTLVVRYYYDAWGNIISTTGTMASTLGQDNPFRYRGYYYDTETGFYYLNARYYNPEWGRFISADPVLDTSNAIGCNMFAYCDNTPVNKADYTGEDAIILIDEDLLPAVWHLGILFQDENGRWWHFYWGTEFSNFIPAIATIDCKPEMSLKPYIGPLTLDGINGSNVYQDEYENMITLRGDFSVAYTYIRSTASQKYNLYANNCSQKSLNALIACNTSYNDILMDAAQFTVPNNAFTQLKISFRKKSPDLASVINSTNNQIVSMY